MLAVVVRHDQPLLALLPRWLPRCSASSTATAAPSVNYFTSAFYIATDVGCLAAGFAAKSLASARLVGPRVTGADVPRLRAAHGPGRGRRRPPGRAGDARDPLLIAAGALGLFPIYYSLTQELSSRAPGQGDRLARLHRLARQRAHAPADRPMDRSDRIVYHGPLRHRVVAPGRPGGWPCSGTGLPALEPRKRGSRRSRRLLNAALARPTFPWGLGGSGVYNGGRGVARNYAEESAVLATLWQTIADHQVLLTFNGKTFDWPMVIERSIRHRLQPGRPRATFSTSTSCTTPAAAGESSCPTAGCKRSNSMFAVDTVPTISPAIASPPCTPTTSAPASSATWTTCSITTHSTSSRSSIWPALWHALSNESPANPRTLKRVRNPTSSGQKRKLFCGRFHIRPFPTYLLAEYTV